MKTLKKIQSSQDTLDSMIEYDKDRLLGSIKTLEKRIISDSKILKTKGDVLMSPRVNLKQAHQLHADLVKNFKETYEDTAFRVTKGYNQSAKLIKDTYKDLNVSMTFTGLDADIISELQTRSYNEYLAYGKSAQEAISSAMYNTVLTKGSYSDLVGSISAALTGNLSTSGKPMSAYADLWANDGLMNFHQSVLMKKGNDAGLNTYLYVGNIMNTTRPFCAARVMNIYTKEEIESWDEDSWKGKSGPALTNRGGWNCRHHWQPIKKDWVEDLEEEIEEDEDIQKELKEAKGIEPDRVISVPSVEEEIVEVPEYQSFDKYLENVDFDWEVMEIDPDDVPTIQNNIIKSRFEDAGNEISEKEADGIRNSIQDYTSELYTEYGEWVRDPESYEAERDQWQVKVMEDMNTNLQSYMTDTQPFDPTVNLYRGKKEIGILKDVLPGDEVDLNYFSSFSSDVKTAQNFTVGGENPVIMVLNKNNEFNSASLAEFSEAGYEKEVLVSDTNRLVCTDTEVQGKTTYMYFDSVEVPERQREVEEELTEEKRMAEVARKIQEEERIAKEELEEVAKKLQEDEKVAQEEAEKAAKKLREVEKIANEEKLDKEQAKKELEEEKLAKEEAEKKLDEAKKIAKEEKQAANEAKEEAKRLVKEERKAEKKAEKAEKKAEKEKLAKEETEKELEEERIAKEKAEKKLEEEVEEKEKVGFVKGPVQKFNKKFAKGDFDWESIEDDDDKIEKMELNILKKRLKDGGITMPKAELEEVISSVKGYSKGDFKNFQEWSFDKSKYPDIPSLDRFRKIEKDLNMYINDTPSFDSNTTIYRGTSSKYYEGLGVGDTLEHSVFTSWTVDRGQATDFALEDTTEGGKIEDPAILVINKGNQTYSSSIAEFSEYGDEQEVLLSDRNKLVLTKVEERDGIKYMYFDTEDVTVKELELKAEKREKEEGKLENEETKKRREYEEIYAKQKRFDKLSISNIEEAQSMVDGTYDWRTYYEDVVMWAKIPDDEWEKEYLPKIKEKVDAVKEIIG